MGLSKQEQLLLSRMLGLVHLPKVFQRHGDHITAMKQGRKIAVCAIGWPYCLVLPTFLSLAIYTSNIATTLVDTEILATDIADAEVAIIDKVDANVDVIATNGAPNSAYISSCSTFGKRNTSGQNSFV